MPGKMQLGHASTQVLAAMLLAGAATPVLAEDALEQVGASGGAGSSTVATTAAASTVFIKPECASGKCDYRLTAMQLVALADKLVREERYDDARPLISALAADPRLFVPHRFLSGMVAVHDGDHKAATGFFREILERHPEQTRVRLELAKTLMAQRKFQSADYHLRLAENDDDLPEEVVRMIGNARSIIRSNRRFTFGFDFGFAPDTNINSATALETVDINFGPHRLPIELDDNARKQSGLGLTASAFAKMRVPTGDRLAIVADLDTNAVRYEDSDFNDYTAQIAAGPELALSRDTRVSVQGLALYRWYGGDVAARQFGAKTTLQHTLTRSKRIALQLDARHSDSLRSPGYTGWQTGANVTYEQVVGTSMLASVSLYGRRDFLESDFFSSKTLGVNAGLAGELPFGINAGLSGGAGYAKYDAPQPVFSLDESRRDWRYHARAYAGLRQVRLAGFSPSLEYSYVRTDSNYDMFKSDRHRVHFKLARYF